MLYPTPIPSAPVFRSRVPWRAAIAVAALIGLGGCADTATRSAGGTPATTPATGETIGWSIGPCFGFCPVYAVRVSPSGAVTFEGERHTATLGRQVREGGAQAYATTADALAAYRPATGTTAQTTCDQRMSDQSTIRITWTTPAGTVTTLEHDRGCRSVRNDALNATIQALPAQLGIDGWAKQTTRPGASRG